MPNESNDKTVLSIKTEFHKIIEIEIGSIKSSLAMQKYIQSTVLSISDGLWNKLNSSSDLDLIHNTSKDLYDISNFCFQLQNNINNLEKLEIKLETLNTSISNIDATREEDVFFDKIKQCHDESVELIDTSLNFNSTFHDFILNFSKDNYLTDIKTEINNNNNNDDSLNEEKLNENIKNSNTEKQTLNIPDDLKENTLIISNIEVILPFTKKDLEEKFKNSNLSSYEEIIDTFYKKSAKSFEHSAISRFKEAYSLIINKEHGSKFQAISLGLELSTNYNLHPAIISACKNLTQLDVYLSCLEYKELSDFHFFDIVYNIPPTRKVNIINKTLNIIKKNKIELSK